MNILEFAEHPLPPQTRLCEFKSEFQQAFLILIAGIVKRFSNGEQSVSEEDFQAIIRIATDDLEYKPSKLAKEFGVTEATISRWRKGVVVPTPMARHGVATQVGNYIEEHLRCRFDRAS